LFRRQCHPPECLDEHREAAIAQVHADIREERAAAAAAAFVSEISASDFVSVGSSAGSIFVAIADVDDKVAALNEYVLCSSSLSVYLVYNVSPSCLSFFNFLFQDFELQVALLLGLPLASGVVSSSRAAAAAATAAAAEVTVT
jgi:hypothetical protein